MEFVVTYALSKKISAKVRKRERVMAGKKAPAKGASASKSAVAKKKSEPKKVIPKAKEIEKESTTRICKIALTPDEMVINARSVAEMHVDMGTLQDEKKLSADQYTKAIRVKEASIASMCDSIRVGYRHGNVACQIVRDFKRGTAITTRLDTKVVIETREIKPEEAQAHLALTMPKPALKVKAGASKAVASIGDGRKVELLVDLPGFEKKHGVTKGRIFPLVRIAIAGVNEQAWFISDAKVEIAAFIIRKSGAPECKILDAEVEKE